MIELKERYVIDEAGAQVAVPLDIEDYRKIIEALEELDTIRVYDEAKTGLCRARVIRHYKLDRSDVSQVKASNPRRPSKS